MEPLPRKIGFISVFTGDGRGKTTAALGTVIRALGAGKRVAIVYFDKGGSHYFERKILDRLIADGLPIEYHASGLDRIDSTTDRFRFGVLAEDKQEAQRGLALVKKLFEEDHHDLIVLDELNTTIDLGMLAWEDVESILGKKPKDLELIITGRNAPAQLIERADLVTEMTLVKHYFYSGIRARAGIDF